MTMETLWFVIVAFLLTAYVVLDGFDLGAGAVHFLIGKTERERRVTFQAIGPVWDGNEVWLVVAGGVLFFAFPRLYAVSFGGFYLPLIIVLWLLILRGAGVEGRSQFVNPVWRTFFDFVFSGASILLAVFFGAALGNVIRGVPLNSDGYFFEPLWTNFRTTGQVGILDWYTVLTGILSLLVLSAHGALWMTLKTDGEINTRARKIAIRLWGPVVALTGISLAATIYVRPQVLDNFRLHRWGWSIPLVVVLSLLGIFIYSRKGSDLRAFLASSVYITGMLAGAAFALYPYVLPSSSDPGLGLTISNTAAGAYGLKVGLIWWAIGIILALGYFTFVYRHFAGKVTLEGEEH
jgi:cytochrome d ubiquinol oxidase subunit II